MRCTRCEFTLMYGAASCPRCGAPAPAASPPPDGAPAAEAPAAPDSGAGGTGSDRTRVLVIAAGVVLAVVAAGLGLRFLSQSGSSPVPSLAAVETTRPPTTGAADDGSAQGDSRTTPSEPEPATEQGETETQEEEPAEPEATEATTPAEAEALPSAAARSALDERATAGRRQVAVLVGSWVPQVSSKCVGVDADLGTDYLPDGGVDTYDLTVQQLLAFTIAMENNYGAITVHPRDIGSSPNKPTSGACEGRLLYMSLAPEPFRSAAAANRWCDDRGIPWGECAARYVANPGAESDLVLRDEP